MEPLKEIRWKQRFENYEKSYVLLDKYSQQELTTDLERAGIIQFFEVTFELGWKVMKDYLEAEGYHVKSPRETIKQAFQMGLIKNGHVWMDALVKRNLTTHTYDEELAAKFVVEITTIFLPAFKEVYEKLSEEIK